MVPYVMAARRGALVSSMHARSMQRARLAGRLAGAAYRNRKIILRATRKIVRYRRSRSYRLSRRVTGGRTTTRQYAMDSQNPIVAQQTLYFRTIQFPAQNTDVNGRIGGSIRLSGFKLCDEFTNNTGYPIEMHYAVLQLKENAGATTVSVTEVKDKFFRDASLANARAIDFVDAGTDNTWKMSMKCNNINPDKFNIITHQRKIMDSMTPNGGPVGTSNPRRTVKDAQFHWKNHKWYPIKKNVTFQGSTPIIPNRPYIVVYWWTTVNRSDYNTLGLDNDVTHEHKDKIYFRNGAS